MLDGRTDTTFAICDHSSTHVSTFNMQVVKVQTRLYISSYKSTLKETGRKLLNCTCRSCLLRVRQCKKCDFLAATCNHFIRTVELSLADCYLNYSSFPVRGWMEMGRQRAPSLSVLIVLLKLEWLTVFPPPPLSHHSGRGGTPLLETPFVWGQDYV